ncbi:MAG: hypothetical protein JWP12_2310 [Bacteroidetes bacterium]|nr:hypothetical protein [Bacteroidota bacterium]
MSNLIHIPEPCSENWNKMQPVADCTRHCATCKTNVHDFSKASFADIDTVFEKNKDVKICGHYHERHTSTTKKVYVLTNALDNAFSKTKLKRFSLLVISLMLLFAGCARRVTKGCRAYGFGNPEKSKAPHTEQTRI